MLNTNLDEMFKSIQVGCDTTFEVNEFGEPRIRGEMETIKDIFLFILLTKPGQYPSLPTLGYDIENKLYAFYDEINEDDIMEGVCSQCDALRSYFDNGMIALKKYKYKNQPSLLIAITGKEVYPDGYMTDRNNSSKYIIGISYDEMQRMVYDIKRQ